MPLYRYRAVTATGHAVEGQLEAADLQSLTRALEAQGQVPLEAGIHVSHSATASLRLTTQLSRRDLAQALQHLATALEVKFPLDRALQLTLSLTERPRLRSVLADALRRVQAGAALSDALSAHAAVLPAYVPGIVRAGEETGDLGRVLRHLADALERAANWQATVRSALLYPAIVMVMVGVTLVLLFGVVLPQFETMFTDMGAELPPQAQLLLGIGRFVQNYGLVVVVGSLLASMGALQAAKRPALRRPLDRRLLQLPILGGLLTRLDGARFARIWGMLLGGGMPILPALRHATTLVRNSDTRIALERAAAKVKEGQPAGLALQDCSGLPILALRMIALGDETARLSAMLDRAAAALEQEVETQTKRLLDVLVPALTVGLGLIVGGTVGTVMSAILSVYRLPM